VTAAPVALATVAPPASAATTVPAGAASVGSGGAGTSSYYLALGDSVPVWDGSHSYAHLLENHYVTDIPGLQLNDIAVSGATTTSMRDGGQYQAALRFLRKHAGHIALITIDIGGNDVVYCATPSGIDMTCVTNALATMESNITAMLAGLAQAAPSVPIIGMNYYDPYLGDWLAGGATRTLALGSLAVVAELNSDLETVYGGPTVTADVQGAFKTADDGSLVGSPWGRVPVDVARACSWLDIVCHRGQPEGFGDDPNVTGRTKIAAAFERIIGKLAAP
jgi:hypothetical protein